jgi:ATP synthase protein I
MTHDDLPQHDSRPPTDLESRLRALRGQIERHDEAGAERAGTPQTASGWAFRIGVELVVALVVGVGIGWLLDRWLGTSPLLLIIFFLLGAVAGMLNVFRAARQMNQPGPQGGR